MKTLSQIVLEEKATAREKAQQARKELRATEAIAAVWPSDEPVSTVHCSRLYGSIGSVHIGSRYRDYGKEDDRCTMADVARLLGKLPPERLWKISNGCLAFRPDSDVSDEEAKKENASEVWGVRLKIDPDASGGHGQQAVEWYARIGNVTIAVEAVLRPSDYPVRVNINARRDKRTGRTIEIVECNLQPNPAFAGHFWIDQRVRWAAGSSEYPNHFTLYWLAIDDSLGAGRAWLEQICGIAE